jgi:hypothetical protein
MVAASACGWWLPLPPVADGWLMTGWLAACWLAAAASVRVNNLKYWLFFLDVKLFAERNSWFVRVEMLFVKKLNCYYNGSFLSWLFFYFVNYFLVFTLLLTACCLLAGWWLPLPPVADGCRFRLWLMVVASACGWWLPLPPVADGWLACRLLTGCLPLADWLAAAAASVRVNTLKYWLFL